MENRVQFNESISAYIKGSETARTMLSISLIILILGILSHREAFAALCVVFLLLGAGDTLFHPRNVRITEEHIAIRSGWKTYRTLDWKSITFYGVMQWDGTAYLYFTSVPREEIWRYMLRCIRRKKGKKAVAVLPVDDGSEELTRQMLRQYLMDKGKPMNFRVDLIPINDCPPETVQEAAPAMYRDRFYSL